MDVNFGKKRRQVMEKDYVIHLKCPDCQQIDMVFPKNAQKWNCPFCNFEVKISSVGKVLK